MAGPGGPSGSCGRGGGLSLDPGGWGGPPRISLGRIPGPDPGPDLGYPCGPPGGTCILGCGCGGAASATPLGWLVNGAGADVVTPGSGDGADSGPEGGTLAEAADGGAETGAEVVGARIPGAGLGGYEEIEKTEVEENKGYLPW